MEILRKSQIKDDKYFKCPHCKAIFTANSDEYRLEVYHILNEQEITVYHCDCPECTYCADEIAREKARAELSKGGYL